MTAQAHMLPATEAELTRLRQVAAGLDDDTRHRVDNVIATILATAAGQIIPIQRKAA